MRVIALIDDPTVERRILEHLGRWAPEPAERAMPRRRHRRYDSDHLWFCFLE